MIATNTLPDSTTRAELGLAAAFRSVLESEFVISDEGTIRTTYGRNVTALNRVIPLVVRPGSEAEVAGVVRVANEQGVALYPISTGRNWGLGSKLPTQDGCVLVDLSRMNQIVEVSDDFAYAIIEPGVTQLQLATYLKEHHPELTFNFTGSFAHTSIVGNVLERGDGFYARVEDMLGVRGILGSGKEFEAGGFWEHQGGGTPSHASRYTAGPDLCGMFAQSAFGIVTRMAFRLIVRPQRRCIFWGTADDDQLEKLVDAVNTIARQGVVNRGSINIGYANRFVQGSQSMGAGPSTPPPAEWSFYILFSGTDRSTAALMEDLTEIFSPVCRVVGTYTVGQCEDPASMLPPFLHPLISPLHGLPDTESIKKIYQLTSTPLPSDSRKIDADQTPFGMKCCIPVVPTRPKDVRHAAELVARAREMFGMNIKPSFYGDGRTLITMHFRTDEQAQIVQAEACEAWLWNAMAEAGFFPYRASIEQMPRLRALRPELFDLVGELKAALDPNGIVSPGRYCDAEL
jgi:4-cresol dehydrogenase (hydroxylating)